MKALTLATAAILCIISCKTSSPETEPLQKVLDELRLSYNQADAAQQSAIPVASSIITNSLCPSNMVEIKGEYCPDLELVCINLDKKIHNVNGDVKCDEFKFPSKCLSKNTKSLNFCMDIYEWPNQKGMLPSVMITWNQMNANCKDQGKRLCSNMEWTKACEGDGNLPYPYGYKRDATACNIDHNQIPGFDASKDVMTPELVAKLDQRVASGAMPNCVSQYGVHDMTGNVDEATVNLSGKPFKNALKGGSWLLGHRNRCRPETIAHHEDFAYYAISGRCCKDVQ